MTPSEARHDRGAARSLANAVTVGRAPDGTVGPPPSAQVDGIAAVPAA
ncbi:MAG: hypothetical protein ACJ79S_01455 [Gemmatimonadaceae bacterium]